jgi:hypothetical protein
MTMAAMMSRATFAVALMGARAHADLGAFVPLPDMTFARYTASAALLTDGSVVLYGPSYDGDAFQPRSQSFVETALIPVPRFSAKLVALPDGGALLIGGSSSDPRTVRYDAATRVWSWGPTMTTARAFAQVAELADGRVLVAGGYGSDGVPLASAELYDPAGEAFSLTGSMPRARQGGIAERLPNGDVLIAGGADASTYGDPYAVVYSPETETFAGGPSFYAALQGLYVPASTRLRDGRVLVSGGWVFTGPNTQRVADDAEIYDPTTHRWTAHNVSPRAEHTLTTLDDGRVLVAGGRDYFEQPTSSTELFDPETNTFTSGPPLRTARFGHTATALPGGRVLVAGGQVGGNQWTASAELYVGDEVFADGFEHTGGN